MWLKNGNLMVPRDPAFDNDGAVNDGQVTWQHALDYVALLNSGNYADNVDWRLPNSNELESLINAGEPDSATWLSQPVQGFRGVVAGSYWSSTPNTSNPVEAWYLSAGDGIVGSSNKAVTNYYVLAVRDGQ